MAGRLDPTEALYTLGGVVGPSRWASAGARNTPRSSLAEMLSSEKKVFPLFWGKSNISAGRGEFLDERGAGTTSSRNAARHCLVLVEGCRSNLTGITEPDVLDGTPPAPDLPPAPGKDTGREFAYKSTLPIDDWN